MEQVRGVVRRAGAVRRRVGGETDRSRRRRPPERIRGHRAGGPVPLPRCLGRARRHRRGRHGAGEAIRSDHERLLPRRPPRRRRRRKRRRRRRTEGGSGGDHPRAGRLPAPGLGDRRRRYDDLHRDGRRREDPDAGGHDDLPSQPPEQLRRLHGAILLGEAHGAPQEGQGRRPLGAGHRRREPRRPEPPHLAALPSELQEVHPEVPRPRI
mmetsp:Transcript_7393/g.18083  ORF Transcript_7393/g.18083 Transcript_7393/m.18083 type:complete len:210 (+) Transcript_7393:1778-2407(+)